MGHSERRADLKQCYIQNDGNKEATKIIHAPQPVRMNALAESVYGGCALDVGTANDQLEVLMQSYEQMNVERSQEVATIGRRPNVSYPEKHNVECVKQNSICRWEADQHTIPT
eukprot:c32593_g1_i1 orf=391-729(+)